MKEGVRWTLRHWQCKSHKMTPKPRGTGCSRTLSASHIFSLLSKAQPINKQSTRQKCTGCLQENLLKTHWGCGQPVCHSGPRLPIFHPVWTLILFQSFLWPESMRMCSMQQAPFSFPLKEWRTSAPMFIGMNLQKMNSLISMHFRGS